ncbi:MAG: hypothetical protein ACREH9_11655 [Pseudomonadota bacterium]
MTAKMPLAAMNSIDHTEHGRRCRDADLDREDCRAGERRRTTEAAHGVADVSRGPLQSLGVAAQRTRR